MKSMCSEETQNFNNTILDALGFFNNSKVYYIAEVGINKISGDKVTIYGVLTDLGFLCHVVGSTICYSYDDMLFKVYTIRKIWKSKNIGDVIKIINCSSSEKNKEFIDNCNLELIYCGEGITNYNEVKEKKDKSEQIMSKYGLV